MKKNYLHYYKVFNVFHHMPLGLPTTIVVSSSFKKRAIVYRFFSSASLMLFGRFIKMCNLSNQN